MTNWLCPGINQPTLSCLWALHLSTLIAGDHKEHAYAVVSIPEQRTVGGWADQPAQAAIAEMDIQIDMVQHHGNDAKTAQKARMQEVQPSMLGIRFSVFAQQLRSVTQDFLLKV